MPETIAVLKVENPHFIIRLYENPYAFLDSLFAFSRSERMALLCFFNALAGGPFVCAQPTPEV
jgi:hypothetical protein